MVQDFPFAEDEYLLIGTVKKPQGLSGEVVVHCYSHQPENLADYRRVVLVDHRGGLSPRLGIASVRLQGGKAIVKLDRVNDRSFAEQICGMGILVKKSDLPDLGEGEYYWHQMIGREAVLPDGTLLGRVQSLFSNGAQDILVIAGTRGEMLVPVHRTICNENRAGQLVIDPPPGLLEVNQEHVSGPADGDKT